MSPFPITGTCWWDVDAVAGLIDAEATLEMSPQSAGFRYLVDPRGSIEYEASEGGRLLVSQPLEVVGESAWEIIICFIPMAVL